MKKKLLVLLITIASTMMPNLVSAVAIDPAWLKSIPVAVDPGDIILPIDVGDWAAYCERLSVELGIYQC